MLCQVSVSAHISGPVVYHVIYSLEMGLHRELNETETVNVCFFTYVFSVQATFSHTDRKIVIPRHNTTTFVFGLTVLSMILVASRTLVK